MTSDGGTSDAELDALQREVSELRTELRAQKRLQRLIAESHSAREDFLSSGHNHVRARIAELEATLRLAQLSRPYRLGRLARQSVDAVKRLRRSSASDVGRPVALQSRDVKGANLTAGVGRPVVFFLPWLTHGGGGEQFARDLAAVLVRDGRTVVVVVTHGSPPDMTDAIPAALEITPHVFDLSALPADKDWLPMCTSILSCLERPVMINVGSTWFYRHLAELRSVAGDGVTVIDELFNHVGHIADDVSAGDAIDVTVVAHDGLRRLLVEHYAVGRPVTTIHVGLRNLGEPPPPRQPSQPLVVAWLGRLSSEKRPLWFVELARELDGHARFVLGGTGPQLREVALAARGVSSLDLTGFVHDPVSLLDAVDLLVLTSEVEGISQVAMEAIARGVPVIATDVGGMAELVRPGVNGDLVSADDLSELVTAVRTLVNAPNELRTLQARVRAAGLSEEFTLPAMADRYRALVA